MHVAIITGGILQTGKAVMQALIHADSIIAADSGAENALSCHIVPDIIVGDFDSIHSGTTALLKQGKTKFLRFPAMKDETDTDLAISYAFSHGATSVSVIGGTQGDRLDHILANVLLLTKHTLPIKLINGSMVSWVETGPKKVEIQGMKHDILSLLPLSKTVGNIETENLHYPLRNEQLELGTTRGISNIFTQHHASVSFRDGILFFIHYLSPLP